MVILHILTREYLPFVSIKEHLLFYRDIATRYNFKWVDFDQFKNDSGAKAVCETTKRTIDNDFVDVNEIVSIC